MPDIIELINSLVDQRRRIEIENTSDRNAVFSALAFYPTDLFLCMASLLETAGAYSFFDPDPDQKISRAQKFNSFSLSSTEVEEIRELGKEWRLSPTGYPPNSVMKKWASFLNQHGTKRVRTGIVDGDVPAWWKQSLSLMMIADEAAEGVGTNLQSGCKTIDLLQYSAISRRKQLLGSVDLTAKLQTSLGSRSTFARTVNSSLTSVFPKLRISTSGCSHRNFSKNLAFLPRAGKVRCHWHMPPKPIVDDRERPIDILVVPYPYEIPSKAFREVHDPASSMERLHGEDQDEARVRVGWSNFEMTQTWLEDEDPIELAKNLLKSAKKDVSSVNGVVFPEYSLTYDHFIRLCEELKAIEKKLEFIVAGSSSNCEAELDPTKENSRVPNGNHVMTCVWHRVLDQPNTTEDPNHNTENQDKAIVSSRRKHHRWMLNSQQLGQYALTSSLDPRIDWWEAHSIGSRELHFFPFREKSVFTSMICEDLARSDPCHEVLRNIGPNLVFVLLMDGPQIPSRWSARYASSLSDDPGSSVLTVTSRGLIDRSNKTHEHDKQSAVAFFSSPFGQTPILLPDDGAKGILVTLTAELQPRQQTIDGRRDHSARTWRMSSTHPIHE